MIHPSREHAFTACLVVTCFTPRQPTLGIAHGNLRPENPFHEAPEAQFLWWCHFQKQFERLSEHATEIRLFPCTLALGGPTLNLPGLPLNGWALVIPSCIYFIIISLTLDRRKIYQIRKFRKLSCGEHLLTVPQLKSLRFSVRPILITMFAYGDQLYVSACYGCGWNTWNK